MPSVHIIGAGISGLAAAVLCAERGARVTIYEASDAAGGRCRSSSMSWRVTTRERAIYDRATTQSRETLGL